MSSTNKTTYYELPQFVDNDIFNPLVDDNDAYSKIDTVLHNIADAEADNASEIVGIKSRLDSAEGDIDALEAQNGDSVLTTTAQTLSGAINELDADISALDGRLDIVEDDINNESTGLKVKVATAENDIDALEAQNGNETLETIAQTLSGGINEIFTKIANIAVTPQMYGAVGDGIADDTNAIISAITANRIVYFPAGSYKITASITLPANTTIFGANENTKIIYEGEDSAFVVNGNGCKIVNLNITGNGNEDYTNTVGTGIEIATDTHNHLISNIIIDKIGTGIKSIHSWDSKFDRVKIYYTNVAIDLNDCTNACFINCTLYLSNIGLKLYNGTPVAYDLYTDNCKKGITIDGYAKLTVYKWWQESGRNSGTGRDAIGIEQIDELSYAIIYDFHFYDNSGSLKIAKVDVGTLGLRRNIKFVNPNLRGANSNTFEIAVGAVDGCVEIESTSISDYTSIFPDKVLVNKGYSLGIHGEYLNNGYRRYTGTRKNANPMLVAGDYSYGTVTLYHSSGIEVDTFIYDNTSGTVLRANAGTAPNILIGELSAGHGINIQPTTTIINAGDYFFEIAITTSGYIDNSDNDWHH